MDHSEMVKTATYRPWGKLREVMESIGPERFIFLGCVGTEDRCTSALSELSKLGMIDTASLVEIIDVESEYSELALKKREKNKDTFESLGFGEGSIKKVNLLEAEEEIFNWIEDCIGKNPKVVLDISSLPKRFFFPAVKILLRSLYVEDLIVVYSIPIRYYSGNLAERPSDWRALPLFGSQQYPDPKYNLAIVGAGFLPFGLPDLLKYGFMEAKPHLFFPFPASPSTYTKTWEFVRKIESSLSLNGNDQLAHVNALDPSDTFDHINWLTKRGELTALFAPYGPKPMSLGMAIYATITSSPVFYTQPRVYHPDYSIGIKIDADGHPLVYGYCLKLNSRNVYQL
jgi:hypothetical protein